MMVRDKLKQICIDKHISLAELGRMYGMETNAFYVKLARNTLKLCDVEKMADQLDCDVVFVDRKTKKIY